MSILFCTPCYGGLVTEPHFRSCLELRQALNIAGMEHSWLTGRNESLIARARNEMTATFLESDYTHMMWLDADIEFTPEDVASLWNLEADVAVGIYPMKKPEKCWYAAWVDGELVKDLDRFSGPIEVDYAGTGFMLIRRSCIDKMIEAYPETKYEGPNGEVYALYNTPVVEGHFDSEDYHFCRKWRALGGKVLADPSVRLIHHGAYAFGSGKFGELDGKRH